MLLLLPPALPPAAVAPAAVESYAWASLDQTPVTDCQRGSRNCFPKDRVGAGEEFEVVAVAVVPQPGPAFPL